MCCKGIWITKNNGSSLWNLVANSNLANFFAFSPQHVDRRNFGTLSSHLCLQHVGRDAERHAVRPRQLRLFR